MKKINLFVLMFLICLVLPNGVHASEKLMCMEVESGKESIFSSDLEQFEKDLKQKVAVLNKNNGNSTSVYKYELKVIDTYTNIQKEEYEVVSVLDVFDKREDAISYFDRLLVREPYVKGNLFLHPVEITDVIKELSDEIICSSLDCKMEIQRLEQDLESNQKLDYEIVVKDVVTDEKVQIVYQENGTIKYFDDYSQAELFVKDYVPSLSGYEFVDNEIAMVNVATKVLKTYLELKKKDTFNTLEEAEKALEEFENEYPESSGSVEKVLDSESTTDGTLEFASEEEALNKKAELEVDNEFEKITATTREEVERIDKEEISEEYATREEAEEVLEILKDNGYVVDAEISEINSGITGNVVSGISRPSASRYEFPIDKTNFVLIKQGSGYVAVWTEYELTDIEKTTFVETYNTVNSGNSKFDGSTTDISMDMITWIFGYDAHDLSNIGTNWGTYTFSKDEEDIIMTCNKISHAIEGYATPKVKYVISGTKYREKKIWYVDYNRTIYNYLYKIEASAFIEEIATKYKVLSNFVKVDTEAVLKYSVSKSVTDEKYELSYEKYIPKITEMSSIVWSIEKCDWVGGTGDIDYPNPPQTGIDTNLIIFIRYFLLSVMMVVCYKTYKLIKNN